MEPKSKLADDSPYMEVVTEGEKMPDEYRLAMDLYPDDDLIRKHLSKEAAKHNPKLRLRKFEYQKRNKKTKKIIKTSYSRPYYHEEDARIIAAAYLGRKARSEDHEDLSESPITGAIQPELNLEPAAPVESPAVETPHATSEQTQEVDSPVSLKHLFDTTAWLSNDLRALNRALEESNELQAQTLAVQQQILKALTHISTAECWGIVGLDPTKKTDPE